MRSPFNAFAFHGRFRTQAAARQSSNVISTVLQTFSAGFALIEAGKSVGNYIAERSRTRELERQQAFEREAMEAQIHEAERQAEIRIQEERKRIQIALRTHEQQLKANLAHFQKQSEAKTYEFGQSMEVWRKEMQLEKLLRQPLRKTLDAIEEMLTIAKQENCDLHLLNSLHDQYVETQGLYNEIVKNYV